MVVCLFVCMFVLAYYKAIPFNCISLIILIRVNYINVSEGLIAFNDLVGDCPKRRISHTFAYLFNL